jgi:hypothetical protein
MKGTGTVQQDGFAETGIIFVAVFFKGRDAEVFRKFRPPHIQ